MAWRSRSPRAPGRRCPTCPHRPSRVPDRWWRPGRRRSGMMSPPRPCQLCQRGMLHSVAWLAASTPVAAKPVVRTQFPRIENSSDLCGRLISWLELQIDFDLMVLKRKWKRAVHGEKPIRRRSVSNSVTWLNGSNPSRTPVNGVALCPVIEIYGTDGDRVELEVLARNENEISVDQSRRGLCRDGASTQSDGKRHDQGASWHDRLELRHLSPMLRTITLQTTSSTLHPVP